MNSGQPRRVKRLSKSVFDDINNISTSESRIRLNSSYCMKPD